jgi:hypothetical protein
MVYNELFQIELFRMTEIISTTFPFSVEDIEIRLKIRLGGRRIQGTDTNNVDYHSLTELWDYIFHSKIKGSDKDNNSTKRQKKAVSTPEGTSQWYNKAFEYWESAANCPISDGKLSLSLALSLRSAYVSL